jgi:hypothetical protein
MAALPDSDCANAPEIKKAQISKNPTLDFEIKLNKSFGRRLSIADSIRYSFSSKFNSIFIFVVDNYNAGFRTLAIFRQTANETR